MHRINIHLRYTFIGSHSLIKYFKIMNNKMLKIKQIYSNIVTYTLKILHNINYAVRNIVISFKLNHVYAYLKVSSE